MTSFKNILSLCCLAILVSEACCRSVQSLHSGFFERNSDTDLVAEASGSRLRIKSNQLGRVLPAPVVAKKLLLLKLKKLIPISILLLKSENGEEAELVPVYQTSLIPSNVEFISTPGGLNGHEDVQAVGIPIDLSNKNDIAQVLQSVLPSKEKDSDKLKDEGDEPLDASEDDDQTVLVDAVKPAALRSALNTKDSNPFEESSLYLLPYQENRGTKQSRRNFNRKRN